MAGLSEDVLRKLITPNAKALSQPDMGRGQIKEGVSMRPGSDGEFDDSFFLADTYEDDMVTEQKQTPHLPSMQVNAEVAKKSKMLSSIKEEMLKNPIDTAALNPMSLESANNGDPMNMNKLEQMIAGSKRVEQKLMGETKTKKAQAASSNGGGFVDYALIKSIVNECIETKFNEMAERGLLNEGATLKGIGLSEGKIKIVDNQGRVFSAKLELTGNTKNKK